MPAKDLLSVTGLGVEYRKRRHSIQALEDISFDVGASETVGLVGESGSGKSTVANAILGLVPVTAGAVAFKGKDVTNITFKERRSLYRHLQVVFQDPYGSLNPARTIRSILAEPLESARHDRSFVRSRVAELLERVHLPPEAANRYPGQFSGGQRQRIAIARALIPGPELVICDEAVSALDLSVQAQVLDLLRELQQKTTLSYLFISHDLNVVRHMCDRVLVLYRGRIMESGSAARVAEAAAHPYTAALHAASPLPDPRAQRQRRASAVQAEETTSTIGEPPLGDSCPFARRCPFAIERCWTERPALRPIPEGGEVACHRYPEWRAEAPHALDASPARVDGTENGAAIAAHELR
jgi:oligopeptide/dipeptide ABC transporter ATP-binding protein